MFDMRYHIASLVAVFFALAIGILLGTVIVDKGVLVGQQQALVKRIEMSFKDIRAENRLLKEEVDAQRKFANSIIPLSIKDRLIGQNIAIISTTKVKSDNIIDLSDGLRKAGAVVSAIKIKEDFKLTEEAKQALSPYFSISLTDGNVRELLLKKMVDELSLRPSMPESATATADQEIAYLDQLKKLGFIVTESKFDIPISAAVILGGADADQDPEKTDLYIITQLKSAGIRLVGAETTDCKKSYMKLYQEAGISTVDNIDQPTGIVSTVFALMGLNGNFGVKRDAEQFMPTFPSP
ncbi:MAG: copper transporter [Actinobacteria bacterium]|nr:copper transporter [Actinomycetota bacterium]